MIIAQRHVGSTAFRVGSGFLVSLSDISKGAFASRLHHHHQYHLHHHERSSQTEGLFLVKNSSFDVFPDLRGGSVNFFLMLSREGRS